MYLYIQIYMHSEHNEDAHREGMVACLYVCLYAYVCMSACMYVCLYVCICMHCMHVFMHDKQRAGGMCGRGRMMLHAASTWSKGKVCVCATVTIIACKCLG